MRVITFAAFVLLFTAPAGAAGRSVTLFLDGARIEQEVAVVKGYAEIPLPAAMQANSLRIRPVAGGEITRVEVVALPAAGKERREQARLNERRERLSARLRALATREEIFTAAAKSQSGKAPRKTKTNPEPVANLRRGTDFALSQLEESYRERRLAEKDLQQVEAQLAALTKQPGAGRSVARVWLAGKGGRVMLSYLRNDLGWKPRYDFRLDSDSSVAITQHAVLPRIDEGAELSLVPAALSAPVAGGSRLPTRSTGAGVARYRFPAQELGVTTAPQNAVTFSFRNQASVRLPSGEAGCYRQGEYLGTVTFAGLGPGETAEVACGR